MAIATDIRKTLTEPLYAVAGAGDYTVEKLRALPEFVAGLGEFRPDPAALRARLSETVAGAPTLAEDLAARVREVYGELAVRGQEAVGRLTGRGADEAEETPVAQPPADAPPVQKAKPAAKRTSAAKPKPAQ